MKVLRTAVILALIAAAPLLPLVLAQSPAGGPSQGRGQGPAKTAQSMVRITAPDNWEMIRRNVVTVKFELVSAGGASGSPNFRLQLDEHSPVFTTDSEYTFSGLELGGHRISVDQVDGNNSPILGTHSEIHFYVTLPQRGGPRGSAVARSEKPSDLQQASFAPDDEQLPPAGSALPLLSVIGFGALVGGIASALNTR